MLEHSTPDVQSPDAVVSAQLATFKTIYFQAQQQQLVVTRQSHGALLSQGGQACVLLQQGRRPQVLPPHHLQLKQSLVLVCGRF